MELHAPAPTMPPMQYPPPHLIMTPHNVAAPYGREYAPPHVHGDAPPAQYSPESRNYTDSQLGVGGVHGNASQLASAAAPAYRPSPQTLPPQQYATPRMPRHATVLKDRGNSENSNGSAPSGGSDGAGHGYGGRCNAAKMSPPSLKGGPRVGPQGKHTHRPKASAKQSSKELRSPDGRRTPVRDRSLEVR